MQSIPLPQSLLATPQTPTSHSLAPNSLLSLTQLIAESIQACDADVHNTLCNNIVLVGGGAGLPGLADRLNWELGVAMPGVSLALHRFAPLPFLRVATPSLSVNMLLIHLSSGRVVIVCTLQAIRQSARTHRGSVARFSHRLGHSISCG